MIKTDLNQISNRTQVKKLASKQTNKQIDGQRHEENNKRKLNIHTD